MQTMVQVQGACDTVRSAIPPKNDKTATPFVFGYPYSRLRADEKGLYIMRYGQRVPAKLVYK